MDSSNKSADLIAPQCFFAQRLSGAASNGGCAAPGLGSMKPAVIVAGEHSRKLHQFRHRHCSVLSRRYAVNWFNLSVLGWVILIAALAIAAYMLHVPTLWIAIATLALLGIGIIASVAKSKPRI
jgi:hypothetical protein